LAICSSPSSISRTIGSSASERAFHASQSPFTLRHTRLTVSLPTAPPNSLRFGFDPDLRLQEVIRLIFARFRELGSARQVLLSMMADQIHFPRPSDEGRMTNFEWMLIRYRNVIAILNNPFYAGVYVYGKSEAYLHRRREGTAKLRA
jgi:Recombinase